MSSSGNHKAEKPHDISLLNGIARTYADIIMQSTCKDGVEELDPHDLENALNNRLEFVEHSAIPPRHTIIVSGTFRRWKEMCDGSGSPDYIMLMIVAIYDNHSVIASINYLQSPVPYVTNFSQKDEPYYEFNFDGSRYKIGIRNKKGE